MLTATFQYSIYVLTKYMNGHIVNKWSDMEWKPVQNIDWHYIEHIFVEVIDLQLHWIGYLRILVSLVSSNVWGIISRFCLSWQLLSNTVYMFWESTWMDILWTNQVITRISHLTSKQISRIHGRKMEFYLLLPISSLCIPLHVFRKSKWQQTSKCTSHALG